MKRIISCLIMLSCSTQTTSTTEAASVVTLSAPPPGPTPRPKAQHPRPYDLLSVWGSSANDIYVLGSAEEYAVFHSANNGETWRKTTLHLPNASLWSVWGRSAEEVYLSGRQETHQEMNLTLQSQDGGLSWREVHLNDGIYAEHLPEYGRFDEVENAGINEGDPTNWPMAHNKKRWREKHAQLKYASTDYTFTAVWGDGKASILVMEDNVQHYSSNAGRNWSSRLVDLELQEVSSLWGSSNKDIYALQENAVSRTTNTGKTWSRSTLDASLREIWGSGADDVYVVGDAGALFHSADHGRSWRRLQSDTDKTLFSIWGSDANNIYVVGEEETILRSVDGGRSWQRLPLSLTPKPRERYQKGVSLGIYYEKAGRTYEPMLDEIAALGADHVELMIHLWQMGQTADTVYQWPKFTISDKRLTEVIRYAQKKGLKVLLYPLLNITSHGGWRGTIAPKDWKKWWSSYRAMILHYADIAQSNGVTLFSIGSEMSSAESMHEEWVSLIEATREVFSGEIIYAANWDRYASLSFEEHLDYVGIDAYFPLTEKADPSYEELLAGWKRYQQEILSWQKRSGRSFLFTELGYRSKDGANQHPWDYSAGGSLDLEEQRLCYQAFREVWQHEPSMGGVYLWDWSRGGKQDKGYSPRGKPAEAEIKEWFSQ